MFSEEEIKARYELLLTQEDQLLRCRIARRANRPISWVEATWSDEDLLWELAYDYYLADDARHRCQNCGVDPREQLKPNGRDLAENFTWRISIDRCEFCDELEEVRHRLSRGGEPYSPPPPRARYVPRMGDEPFLGDEQSQLILPRGASPGR